MREQEGVRSRGSVNKTRLSPLWSQSIRISHATIIYLGLEVEGLYRMSGKKNDVLRLKAKFDTSELLLPNVVTSVIMNSVNEVERRR